MSLYVYAIKKLAFTTREFIGPYQLRGQKLIEIPEKNLALVCEIIEFYKILPIRP